MGVRNLRAAAENEVHRNRAVLWREVADLEGNALMKAGGSGQSGFVVAASLAAIESALEKHGMRCVAQYRWLCENAVFPHRAIDSEWRLYTKRELSEFRDEGEDLLRKACARARMNNPAAVATLVERLDQSAKQAASDTEHFFSREQLTLQGERGRRRLRWVEKAVWIGVGAVPAFFIAWYFKK